MPECAMAIQQLAASFKFGVPRPLKEFQKMLGLMASVPSVLQLGLLHMRPLMYWLKPRVPPNAWRHGRLCVKVSQACIAVLAPWKNKWITCQWMERGVPLGMVVSKNASNLGWGMLCDGKLTFSLWSKKEGYLHINCLRPLLGGLLLETMLAVCLGLHTFLPDMRGHKVLVCSDSMMVVPYINRQGGLSSRPLFILAEHLLKWAQLNLRSLRAKHVPGKLN